MHAGKFLQPKSLQLRTKEGEIMHRRFTGFGVSILAGTMLLSGCATKKFVRQEVAPVNQKVTEVGNQTRENAERIDGVDRRATQGINDAKAAATAAAAADTKATQAGTAAAAAQTSANTAQQRADTANQGVQAANTRITTVETRISSLDQWNAGQPEMILFKVGSSKLEKDAEAKLDTIAGQVSGLKSGFMVEIQGFASAEGGESLNLRLSQARADVVQRYLVSKNVPLFRISMVGLGVDKPVGDNKTRAGREQNRRVEVRVLRAAGGTGTSD